MPVRLALGLGITAVMFAIAGRRFFWLYRLISAGPAGGARAGSRTCRSGSRPSWSRWAARRSCSSGRCPGLAHAFTFWGFTILLLTIIEAFGRLFQREFDIPLIGQTVCGRLHRGLLRRGRHRGPPRVRRHPGQAGRTCGALALLRLPHRRALARAAHDFGVIDHPAALPGRPGQHRQLPLRLVGLRLPRPGQRRSSPSAPGSTA